MKFIPKPGKPSYSVAKIYSPICLSCFLLNILERLIDMHIRDNVLGRDPLHLNQHAYHSGKSTDTALSSVINTIEKALKTQKISSGAFLNIEEAFDSTSFEVITSALLR